MNASPREFGLRLRVALGAPEGASRVPTPAGGWPVVEGAVIGALLGPFLGLEGPGFEKAWYVLDLATPLPEDFDPFYTRRAPVAGKSTRRVLLRPELRDPPPPGEVTTLPSDVIGAALAGERRAAVSVYAGLEPDGALPDRISLADLKAGRLRWVCAARAEVLPICS